MKNLIELHTKTIGIINHNYNFLFNILIFVSYRYTLYLFILVIINEYTSYGEDITYIFTYKPYHSNWGSLIAILVCQCVGVLGTLGYMNIDVLQQFVSYFFKNICLLIKHIYKLIIRSIIIRLLLYGFSSLLFFMEITSNSANTVIYSIIPLLIIISLLVSKNKIKQLFNLSGNILILTLFWYNVNKIGGSGLVTLLLANSVLLTFDDWDFGEWADLSHILNKLELHDKSIGDPPTSPNFNLLIYDPDNSDNSFFKNWGKSYDPSSWDMNDYRVSDFKKHILVDGIKYNTSLICKAYALKEPCPAQEFPIKKGFISHKYYEYFKVWFSKNTDWKEFIKDLKTSVNFYTYEYNTLSKAMMYYKYRALNIADCPAYDSYRHAAEGWQKRQIVSYNIDDISRLVEYYNVYNLFNYNFSPCKFDIIKYHKPSLSILNDCAPKWSFCIPMFEEYEAFKETRENYLYLQMEIILYKKIIDELGHIDMTYRKALIALENIHKWFYKEYAQYLELWTQYKNRELQDLSRSQIQHVFLHRVKDAYYLHEFRHESNYPHNINYRYENYFQLCSSINSILKTTLFSSDPKFSWAKSYAFAGMESMLFSLKVDSGLHTSTESKIGFTDTKPDVVNKFSHSNYLRWIMPVSSEKTPYYNKPVVFTYSTSSIYEGFGFEKKLKPMDFQKFIGKDTEKLVYTHDIYSPINTGNHKCVYDSSLD